MDTTSHYHFKMHVAGLYSEMHWHLLSVACCTERSICLRSQQGSVGTVMRSYSTCMPPPPPPADLLVSLRCSPTLGTQWCIKGSTL